MGVFLPLRPRWVTVAGIVCGVRVTIHCCLEQCRLRYTVRTQRHSECHACCHNCDFKNTSPMHVLYVKQQKRVDANVGLIMHNAVDSAVIKWHSKTRVHYTPSWLCSKGTRYINVTRQSIRQNSPKSQESNGQKNEKISNNVFWQFLHTKMRKNWLPK